MKAHIQIRRGFWINPLIFCLPNPAPDSFVGDLVLIMGHALAELFINFKPQLSTISLNSNSK
jgi:hypothetical protein